MTAARRYGLWVLDDDDAAPPHVWIDPQHHLRTRGDCICVRHREAPPEAVGMWTVPLVQCLIEIAWCRGDESFFAALESARSQKKIGRRGLDVLRAHVPVTMRWLVDFARADAGSGLESILRLRLHRLGIHVSAQVAIPGAGDVDFVIGDCLILEADGKENHDGSRRHKDLRRDALAMRLGFVTLRFDYALIIHEWDVVEDAIIAALARRLDRSPASLRRELEVGRAK